MGTFRSLLHPKAKRLPLKAHTRPHEKLLAHWPSEATGGAGESEDALRKFEAERKIRLPVDFRNYLGHVNREFLGRNRMITNDASLYSFWTLDELKSVPEECPDWPDTDHLKEDFVFADWAIWCWAYSICLTEADFGKIRLVGSEGNPFVARSFAEFVDAYLTKPAVPVGM